MSAELKNSILQLLRSDERANMGDRDLADAIAAIAEAELSLRAPLPAEQPSNPVGYFNAEHGVFWTFSELSADSALIRKGIAVPVFTAARIVGQQTNGGGK